MVKESRRKPLRATATLLFALLCPLAARPEGKVSLPAEAPASLFAVELGGADAELFVKGSWEADLTAQGGFDLAHDGGFSLASLTPLLFTQSPDLYLSFVLFRHYFVEAKVVDEVSQARYSFGYRGGEDELLREVKVGNDGISFFTLPFISFGEGSYRSFGAEAKFKAEGFEGRAMLRYDQAARSTKRWKGGSELTETDIASYSFVRGRWFYTNEAPGSDLALYAVSASGSYEGGDGNKYRKLESGEFSYSTLTRFIALSRASDTKLVAYYGGATGSATVSLSGVGSCVVLYDPDVLTSAYQQVLCRYSTSADPDLTDAYVRDTASGLKDSAYEVSIDAAGYAEVTRSGSAATPLTAAYPRPFEYTLDDDGLNWIYATDLSSDSASKAYAPVSTREIVIETSSAVSSMTIDSDYIPGSVEVTRDGVAEYAFTVDPATYAVSLASPAGANEVIEVSYLRESSERKTGNLAAGLGGVWSLGEGRSAWAAIGLRWALPGVGYGSADAANPGSVTLTAGEKDGEGAFTHKAAIAGQYSKGETSDRYRIEGMEGSGSYATSFRPTATSTHPTDFSATEMTDSLLKSRFPDLVSTLHSDGTNQQALKLCTTTTANWSAELAKVIATPSYSSFGSFSFFVMTSAAAGTLTISLDEGASGSAAVKVPVNLSELTTGVWHRIVVKYGDLRVYVQDEEGGSLVPLATPLTSLFDATSTASRVVIGVTSAAVGQAIWVDELMLEGSTGSGAILFQGELAYANASFKVGEGRLPFLQGIDLKADLSAGLHEASYASGGASAATALGPLGLKLKARGSAAADEGATMSGGHELRLPAQSFPVALLDGFDFNAATGAFGKEDKISLSGGSVASLELGQKSSWTPGSASIEGVLAQEWTGTLSALGSRLRLVALATNKSRPASSPGFEAADYGSAWLGSFEYLLPAFESASTRRKESLSLSASLKPGADILSATIAATAEPSASDAGLRRDEASAKLALPLAFGSLSVAPYYKRAWADKREGCGSGFEGDAILALGDLADLAPLYSPNAFYEFGAASALSSFASATAATEEATFYPEAGLTLSRQYGSYWYDLIAPASLSLAYRRELARSGDTITDAGVWDASFKTGALNLLGAEGAYPLTSLFDSDEYQATVQATVRSVAGESEPRLKIQAQHLATLLAGSYDKLNVENQLYVSTLPAKREWSEKLSVELSRRAERHWLIDLCGLVLPAKAAAPEPQADDAAFEAGAEASAGQGDKPKLSIVSAYLQELAAAKPIARNTEGLNVTFKRIVTDDVAPPVTWSLEEYYEGKLTFPERLTIKAKGSLTQSRDGDTKILSFGGSLSLGLTITF